jgi:hypothetical protein
MNISKVRKVNNIRLNKINIVLACFLIVILSIPVAAVAGSNHSAPLSRGPRLINDDSEPNNSFNTASELTKGPAGMRVINANFTSGDNFDYFKIYIDYGTKTFDVKGNLTGTSDADYMVFFLDTISVSGSGLYMSLYDPDQNLLGVSSVTVIGPPGNQGNFTLIAQYKGWVYIKVQPNQVGATGQYRLTIFNYTEPKNNITNGKVFDGQYLDYTFDNADFYTFDSLINQKIDIKLDILTSNCDFDLYLFDGQTPTWVRSSTRFGRGSSGAESIIYPSPTTTTYYIRVVAKIDGTYLGNRGDYKLTCTGNLPPFWNNSFIDYYELEEDDDPFNVAITPAYFDVNFGDQITIEILDNTTGIDIWRTIPSTVNLNNITVNLNLNPSDNLPQLRISPGADKFGTETFKIRATDDLAEFYTEHEFKIKINPINDLPILNGTNLWINGYNVNPSVDGTKLTGFEGKQFVTQVTAYDPVDPWDVLFFSDNTDLFDVHPITGEISFLPSFHINGHHMVEITVRDNSTEPNETTKEIEFIIEGGTIYPKVSLLGPGDGSVQYTLSPEFTWVQTHEDFMDKSINYELYLSTEQDLVQSRDKSVLNASLTDTTFFMLQEPLEDKTTFFWTVVPNDGLHLGKCESGVFSFTTNSKIEIPRALPLTPNDKQMLDTNTVTLTWELDYAGTEPVKYDLYFEVNMEDILNRNSTPYKLGLSAKSYEVKGLYPNKYYYWQIVPWTSKIRPARNESEIRSFYTTDEIPGIDLITPVDKSIQYETWVTLTWDIQYETPEDIICELYYGTLTNPSLTLKKINITNGNSYTIYDLPDDTYFWKVVPYISTDLRGDESEVWTFSIYHSTDMIHTNLISPVNITIYSQLVTLSWVGIYDETVDVTTIWYDIYVDNSTNIPWEMTRVAHEFRQNDYPLILPMEPKKTYYWYVIPHADTADSHLVGYCSSGVVNFEFDFEQAQYSIELKLDNSSITMKPGSSKTVYFTITNQGNRDANVDITTSSSITGNINLTLNIRRKLIDFDGSEQLELTILALPNAKEQDYIVTVKATVTENQSASSQDTLTVKVEGADGTTNGGGGNGDKKGDSDDSAMMTGIIIAAIVIIIVVVLLFLIMRRKRKPAEAPPSSLDAQATTLPTGQVPEPAPTQPQAYQPTQAVAPVQPVQPIQPVKPVQPVQPQPVQPVQPQQPVQPVQPQQPVQPVQPVKPVAPVAPVTPSLPQAPVQPVSPSSPPPATTPPVSTTISGPPPGPAPVRPLTPVKPIKPE